MPLLQWGQAEPTGLTKDMLMEVDESKHLEMSQIPDQLTE
mgnify:CR=1 FL=1